MAYVKWYGLALSKKVKEAMVEAGNRAGVLLEREIKISMKDAKTRSGGGLLRQKARGKRPAKYHYPSVPGSVPAVDTGRLRASITFQVSEGGGSEPTSPSKAGDGVKKPPSSDFRVTCVIGTNVEYGRHLEFGTVKMAARPFLRPAFEKHKDKILGYFRKIAK